MFPTNPLHLFLCLFRYDLNVHENYKVRSASPIQSPETFRPWTMMSIKIPPEQCPGQIWQQSETPLTIQSAMTARGTPHYRPRLGSWIKFYTAGSKTSFSPCFYFWIAMLDKIPPCIGRLLFEYYYAIYSIRLLCPQQSPAWRMEPETTTTTAVRL